MNKMSDELDFLNYVIEATISRGKKQLKRENIGKINPQLHTNYNSINILVGRQNSGKTYSVLKEIIKISHIDPKTHMLIYVTKNGEANDVTFETLKNLINLPVVFTSQDNAEKVVKSILEYKQLYNRVKAEHLENKIIDEQVQELRDSLMIKDLRQPFLHTILFFEDTANSPLFKKPTQFFPQLVAKCRHVGCSFFFAVQFWKSLPTELKANVSTIYIFPSYSKQQLHYILYQIPLSETFDVIYEIYQKLGPHDKIIVDAINGNIQVETLGH
jgi:hypothetical protein